MRENWQKTTLGNLGKFKTSSVDKKSKNNEKFIKLVNYMDVYSNKEINNKIRFQNVTAPLKQINNSSLMQNDILFTPSSETPNDIGHSSIITENIKDLLHSYHTIRFRINDKNIFEKEFLKYVFSTENIFKYFYKRSTGSTRYTLNKKDFEECPVYYPLSKSTQKDIVNKLNSVENIIYALSKKIEKKNNLKKSVLNELLQRGLNTSKFKTFNFQKIPAEWEVVELKDLVDIDQEILSENEDPNYSFYYIDISSVKPGEYIRPRNKIKFINAPSRARKKFIKNDILFSTVRPNLQSFVHIKDDVQNYVCSTGFAVLKTKSENNASFIYNSLFSNFVSEQIHKLVAGTNYPAITSDELKKIKFFRPKLDEQIKIVEIIEPIDQEIILLNQKIIKIKNLKKSLMKNIFDEK